jgi:hypothetical protein
MAPLTAPKAHSNKPQKTQKNAEAGHRTFCAFLRLLRFQVSSGSAAFQF